mgnify:CR=1 FL=1
MLRPGHGMPAIITAVHSAKLMKRRLRRAAVDVAVIAITAVMRPIEVTKPPHAAKKRARRDNSKASARTSEAGRGASRGEAKQSLGLPIPAARGGPAWRGRSYATVSGIAHFERRVQLAGPEETPILGSPGSPSHHWEDCVR